MMKRTAVLAILLLSSSLFLACNRESKVDQTGSSASTVTGTEPTPEQLGELGARIKKNPADAARLLSEKGLTEESFETAIRKVTEDKEASRRYAEAFRETEQKL